MVSASSIAVSDPATSPRSSWMFKVIGLAIVTVLPALFWTALLAASGHAVNVTFAPSALALTAAAITLFLAAVCAPIMARA